MGKFNHVRYVVVILVAIGLFLMANIEMHVPLTSLNLDDNFSILKEEMYAKYWKNDLTEQLNMNYQSYHSKMQAYQKSKEILESEHITRKESLAKGLQAFRYTSYISMLLFANFILKWDSKVMLAIGIGGMSLCNLLLPTILPLNIIISIIICILQGFFHGMIFPIFLTVMSFWTPIMENTTLISISLFGYWLGLAFSGNISLVSTNLDVPFYVFGALGLCWTVMWSFLAKAEPSDDPKITQTEMKYILSNGNRGGITTLTSYIRKRIFITKSTLLNFFVILCIVFNFTIAALMLTFIGLNKMLDDTVLYPHLFAAFVIVAIALTSDYLRKKYCLTKIRKTVICTGLLCSAIMMPFVGIYYPEDPTFYSVLRGTFIIVQAIILTSYLVNLVDVMHHAAGYALGVFLGLTGLITFLVVVNIKNEGNVIFWVVTALNAVGCLLFAICGSAKREIWVMNQAAITTETSIALKEISNKPATPSNVLITTN